ncbi:transcription factor IIA alpha/beta subunit [Mycena galericulata]|nr:transcription factor IIA alpha/beta subunit [Mycena galericulata]
MSNKIVPATYRVVIDDVITAIRPAFEEFGVAEDVLVELQHKWETKVMASRVADFDKSPPAPVLALPGLPHYVPPRAPPVKPEPSQDPRYTLAPPSQYALPTLPGPPAYPPPLPLHMYRLPQTDGPAGGDSDDDEDEDEDEEVPIHAPRTAHPSLPPPLPGTTKGKSNSNGAGTSSQSTADDDDADADPEAQINSDLDDSDTDNEVDDAEGGPEGDIVFCTYDKVARVKNKWKCVLKDGMVHTGGKDYLFTRCTGEFEW